MPDDINTGGGSHVGGDVSVGRDFVARDQITNNIYKIASAYTPGALHQLRAMPEHFVGRAEELAALLAGIRAGGAVAITSVQGLGGVGKTALAIVAGHALSDAYPDAQLFLPLGAFSGNPRTAGQARDDVLRAFYPDAKLPDDDGGLWALYAHALQGKRALLILDDAKDDAQVERLRPPPGCAMIVTSRNSLSVGQPARLNTLRPADAVNLLKGFCPRLSETEAGDVAKACGYLPQALRIAGAFLKTHRSKPASEYLRELNADPLKRLGDEINGVLERSWSALSATEQTAWAALSIMPTSFTREAGVALLPSPTRVISRGGDGVGVGAGEILDALAAANLLEYDETAERLYWHDLVRAFAAKKLDETQREAAQRRHAAYFIQVGDLADQLYMQGGENVVRGLALFDRERAHLEAAFESLRGLKAHRELIELVDAVVYTGQALRFHPRQRMVWLEVQREAARASGDKESEGNALGNLGLAYWALGDARRAIGFHEQCLTLHREIGDRRGEGTTLGNLGSAYYSLGDVRRAIEFYEQDLAIAHEIGDRSGEGAALGNLGLAYWALGDASRAIWFFEQDLAIAREVGDRRGEGAALGNLGLAYWALGDAPRAIGFYEQYLVIAREIGDRRGEGNSLGNLGAAYAALGETDMALSFIQSSFDLHHDAIGNLQGEAEAMMFKGIALVARDVNLAEQEFERGYALCVNAGFKNNMAKCDLWFAQALAKHSFAAQAKPYAQRAFEYYASIGSARADMAKALM